MRERHLPLRGWPTESIQLGNAIVESCKALSRGAEHVQAFAEHGLLAPAKPVVAKMARGKIIGMQRRVSVRLCEV